MKLDVSLKRLEAARDVMGAIPVQIDLRIEPQDPIAKVRLELEQGKEVDLSEVESNSGALLSYAGHQVILYIRDQKRAAESAISGSGNGYRFHVADCRKLKEMRAANRYERYVVTTDATGSFLVRGTNAFGKAIDGMVRLPVCQFCLDALNYEAFRSKEPSKRRQAVKDFNLSRFFKTYSSYFEFLPRRRSDDDAPNYGPDWPRVSKAYRESVKWVCEKCSVNLAEARDLLHVHHINGDSTLHVRSNLRALCADCHSKEPDHSAMCLSHAEKQRIARLRNKQGVSRIESRSVREQKKAWEKVAALADEACLGLLDLCRRQGPAAPESKWLGYGAPPGPPEVGAEFMDDGSVVAMVELAWRRDQVAIVLEDGSDARWLRTRGWTVLSVGEAMAKWFS